MNASEKNVEVMLHLFRAVERRDDRAVFACCHPRVEFLWPPSLPYGGDSARPREGRPSWSETWTPLQPSDAERSLEPRVVAAGEHEVVIRWRQKGVSPAGDRCDGEVLGLYQLRDEKLVRAQMFYFDGAAVRDFLSRARAGSQTSEPAAPPPDRAGLADLGQPAATRLAIEKARNLLAMHGRPILVLPNAWDVASARVVAAAGARAVATSSAAVAAALGYPDGERLPRELMLETVRRIAAAMAVPVTADLEAGYGRSPEEVAATVRGVLAAGAVGINLEDGTGDAAAPLRPLAEQVERIRAVRSAAAAAGVPLVLNARVDVYLAQAGPPADRFAEAVRRSNAYREAGADCLFVPAVSDPGLIARLVREAGGPLSLLAGRDTPPVPELERLGVARVSVGSGLMRAALGLARDAARELLEDGTYTRLTTGSLAAAEWQALLQEPAAAGGPTAD
jgi:2-methylisocitrate lyase-like PEP mutase family enzyme/ketosteroid isomerase-like protein